MKTILFTSLLVAWAGLAYAQSTFGLKGQINDETGAPMVAATVTLLQVSDSVMVQFAISKPDGSFEISRIKAGNYICRISYVGYASHGEKVSFSEGNEKVKTLEPIQLQPDASLLEDVTVEGERIPLLIDGDTVTYDAKAFNTRPNAVVEDLLKKLPGVEVERDGSIKAHGEKVNKVLVDGKEFFGDDPKMATKNLPAEAVDKVQVYDKASDFAEFSGIDDGNEQKTINLQLKEDHKNGRFGNVAAGYGTDDRYQLKANVNQFGGNTQLSVIGNHNNINEQGFSMNDYINFMGGLQSMMSGGGGSFSLEIDSDIPLGNGFSDGLMTSTSGGINLNQDLGKDTKLHGNYLGSRLDNTVDRISSRTNFLESGEQFNSNENTLRLSTSSGHAGNLRLKHNFSKASKLEFNTKFTYNQGENQSNDRNQVFNSKGELQNEAFNQNDSEGSRYSVQSDLSYNKRFLKLGRTFSFSLNATKGLDESEGNVNTFSTINTENGPVSNQLRQRQNNENDQLDYGLKVGFTEPIANGQFLEFQVESATKTNGVQKDFFDRNQDNQLNLNEDLSNKFDRNYQFNKAEMKYSYNSEKMKFSAGMGYQFSTLQGDLIYREEKINQDFKRWLPFLRAKYEFGSGKTINFRYTTSLREPSLEQLQPIVNNTNPLNIYEGNPNLRAEFQHNANLMFMWYDQFSFTSFFAFLNATYTEDKIINSSTIDNSLRQLTKPVNINDDWLLTGHLSFGRPLKAIGTKFNIDHRLTYNHSYLYLNNQQDVVDRWVHGATFRLEKIKSDVLDISAGIQVDYNTTRYAENDLLDQDFLNRTWFVDVGLNLKNKWVLSSSLDYSQFSNESFGNQPDRAIWKASASYFFLNDNRGELKLSAFDLLNQNIGVNRNATSNFIETERVNTLGRYFMLSFVYKLAKFGGDSIHFESNRR